MDFKYCCWIFICEEEKIWIKIARSKNKKSVELNTLKADVTITRQRPNELSVYLFCKALWEWRLKGRLLH